MPMDVTFADLTPDGAGLGDGGVGGGLHKGEDGGCRVGGSGVPQSATHGTYVALLSHCPRLPYGEKPVPLANDPMPALDIER